MLQDPVLRELPGYLLSCSATGTPPIYIAWIRTMRKRNEVLVNTTNVANILVKRKGEGNYTCLATNKYGIDSRQVSIIFAGTKTVFFFCVQSMSLSSTTCKI